MSDAQQPFGWIVTLETRHFTFEAHGLTEESANEAMGRALDEHARQYGPPAEWWREWEGGFQTHHFMPGTGFRDGSPL